MKADINSASFYRKANSMLEFNFLGNIEFTKLDKYFSLSRKTLSHTYLICKVNSLGFKNINCDFSRFLIDMINSAVRLRNLSLYIMFAEIHFYLKTAYISLSITVNSFDRPS